MEKIVTKIQNAADELISSTDRTKELINTFISEISVTENEIEINYKAVTSFWFVTALFFIYFKKLYDCKFVGEAAHSLPIPANSIGFNWLLNHGAP